MNVAVLTEPGGAKPGLSPRAVVLVAIVGMHALMVYLLVNASVGGRGMLDASFIEAEIIPADRRVPSPPTLPPVILDTSIPDVPPPQPITIDVPADEVPTTTQAIDTRGTGDFAANLPMTASTPPVVDPIAVIRPRPISGPNGTNRYPNASIKAKESGTVEMNICVSSAGTVDSVEVAQSSGFPRLDDAALGLASEYRFQPATRAGHPVAACAHYRIIFKVRT